MTNRFCYGVGRSVRAEPSGLPDRAAAQRGPFALPLSGVLTVGLVLVLFCASLQRAAAQTPLRITSAQVSDGSLNLAWTGDSLWYEVQSTQNIGALDWHPVFRTAETSVGLLLSGKSRFFRVVALAAAPVLVVEDQRRMQILDEISKKIALLPGADGKADSQALFELVSRFPELEGVGVSEDTSVYGRFQDGRPLIIINNRGPLIADELEAPSGLGALNSSGLSQPTLPSANSFGSAVARPVMLQGANAPVPTGMPDSRRAVLLQATFEDIVTPMLKYLNPAFQNRGYQVTGGEASLRSLLNLESFGSDIGVFYIDSHGGVGLGLDKQINGTTLEGSKGLLRELPVFVIATSTEVTAENEKVFKPLADQGELVFAFIGPGANKGLVRTGNPKPYYCITPAFVKRHWRFAKNAFVYIDTCHGGSAGAATFRQACFNSGASLYAGWTDSVKNTWAFNKATLRLFDTLLGGSQIYQIQPRQRAFDLSAVKKYMNGQGFLHDQSPGFPGAVLTFFPGPSANGEFGLLTPSLRQMGAAVEPGKVYIDGLFDPELPATVQVQGNGSAEFEVMPVDRSTIVVPWTGKQSPSAGNVTVIQRSHPSNTVPMSEWRLKAHMIRPYANAQREPFANIDFGLHLRADVHKPRIVPFGEPFFLGNSAIAEPDSTCQVLSVQGMYDEGRVTVEWMLPGPVVVPWGWYFDSLGSSGFKARVIFASESVVKFEVAATARDSMTVIITNREGEETRSAGDPAAISTHSGTQGPIDASYAILPGDDSSSPGAQAFGGRFSWESAAGSFAPDKNAPGYAE